MGIFDTLFGMTAEKQTAKVPKDISSLSKQLAAQLLLANSAPADQNNLGRLLTFLEKTPSGWADVQAVVKYGVKVKFDTSDGGALYQPYNNLIVLNRMKVPRLLATYFCHESTHAQQKHEGRYGDAMTQSKEAFAEAIVQMETETFLREAIVGRELLHFERSRGIKDWQQSLNEHPLQMWFALVHRHRYATRVPNAVLEVDQRFTAPELRQWLNAVKPYFRTYVEPYRPVQYLKWDIAQRKRPPVDSDTMREVLSASFNKQSTAARNPYMGAGPKRTKR